MQLELVNAIASLGTVVLLGATALAGIIQLRHLRAGNELGALLSIERDFRSPALQDALCDVQSRLAARIEDPEYRAQLSAAGYVDPGRHPEMLLCNWFNRTGALVRRGFVKEELFLDSFGRLVSYYWQLLGPVVALLRRSRGRGQYASFEYLAFRAAARQAVLEGRSYPRSAPRLPLADPWLDEDTRRPRNVSGLPEM
jgi:hypothetical protein